MKGKPNGVLDTDVTILMVENLKMLLLNIHYSY